METLGHHTRTMGERYGGWNFKKAFRSPGSEQADQNVDVPNDITLMTSLIMWI